MSKLPKFAQHQRTATHILTEDKRHLYCRRKKPTGVDLYAHNITAEQVDEPVCPTCWAVRETLRVAELERQLAEADNRLQRAVGLLRDIHDDSPDQQEWLYAAKGEKRWINDRDALLHEIAQDRG